MTTPDLPPLEWTSLNLSDLEWNRAMIRRARERLNELERLRDGQRAVFGDVLDKKRGSREHVAVETDKENNREVDL